MQPENLREYATLRTDLINIKNCITSYMGFVIGGSGASLLALTAIGKFDNCYIGISIVSFTISTLVSLILLILIYKFNSHNRYAGYCKLLNHERFNYCDDNTNIHFMLWEISIDRLRLSDINKESLINMVKELKFDHLDDVKVDTYKLVVILREYTGKFTSINEGKIFPGCKILFKTFMGKIKTTSWAYPALVVSIFFLLVSVFLSTGIYFLIFSFIEDGFHLYESIIIILIALITILFQAFLWKYFSAKLYDLIKGNATVDSYFWRFLPIRVNFLNSYGIHPSYLFLTERIDEIIKSLDQ